MTDHKFRAFAYDPGAGRMAARDATKSTVEERALNLLRQLDVDPTPDALDTAEKILIHEQILAREAVLKEAKRASRFRKG
jgi:hypothetical protein